MPFLSFIRSNPALAPLFLFAGGGVVAAASFSFHVLKTHPEIEIDKKNNTHPWQNIQQNENVKLMKTHSGFYKNHKKAESSAY